MAEPANPLQTYGVAICPGIFATKGRSIMNRRTSAYFLAVGAGLLLDGRAFAQSPASADAAVTSVSVTTRVAASAGASPDSVLPSTKEILQKYEKASGGHNVWANLSSREMKGVYQTEDSSGFAGIDILSKAPNKTFTKIALPNGLVIREICDGKAVWVEDYRGGMHELTGPALKSRVRQASFNEQAEVLLLAITGRVLGTEKVGSHSAYVIEFSPEKNITSKMYFDTDSGLAVRIDYLIHKEGGDYQVENYLDDYRSVDGAYYPFRLRHVEKGNAFTIRFTQIKNNVLVDDSIFFKPESSPH
jgi:outer membrane lipoprotein-sorting protein